MWKRMRNGVAVFFYVYDIYKNHITHIEYITWKWCGVEPCSFACTISGRITSTEYSVWKKRHLRKTSRLDNTLLSSYFVYLI